MNQIGKSVFEVVMDVKFVASYYNLLVPYRGGALLFNGHTSALVHLSSNLLCEISSLLGPKRPPNAGCGYKDWRPPIFSFSSVSLSVRAHWETLISAGIFVPDGSDEREQLRSEFVRGRSESPLLITMTSTLNCNMRCYYCYQKDGQLDHMSLDTCDEIIEWAKMRLEDEGRQRLYIDWYGGEPMLNQEVIEHFSDAMIDFCERTGRKYKAAMICNGTNWPDNPGSFLAKTRIESVQFSLDGPERHHNKRRSVIDASASRGRIPSFEQVMSTIDGVLPHARVYLRINVDPWSGWDCLEVVDEIERRGWFRSGYRFCAYLAAINAMTEHCSFIERTQAFSDFESEFSAIQNEFFNRIGRLQNAETLERGMYFPVRKLINCGAVNKNSIIFGPNGLMYKCGLDVGDHFRAHATLSRAPSLDMGTVQAVDRWDNYDPFFSRPLQRMSVPSRLSRRLPQSADRE